MQNLTKTWIGIVAISLLSLPCYAKGTGIQEAARQGDLSQLESYLANDPKSISSRDGAGRTPLTVAAIGGQKEAVAFLLSHGADVNDKGFMGMTPLADMAAAWGQRDDEKCTVIAELLLLHGALINAIDQYGDTPLCWAAESGKKQLVQLLIEKGADVSFNHHAPLHLAALNREKEVVQILMKAGAHFNPKDIQP